MVSTKTLAGLLTLATSALAAAVPNAAPADLTGAPPGFPTEGYQVIDFRTEDEKLAKRTNGAVYVCDSINFSGSCAVLYTSYNAPMSLIGTQFNNAISSAGADPGTYCFFYDGYYGNDCGGQGYLAVNNPGISDFRQYPWPGNPNQSWNDIVSCIKCRY